MSTIPAWLLDNPRETIPEQCSIPMWVGVAPVWSYSPPAGGGFCAFLALESEGDTAWDCDHVHEVKDDAWSCLRAKLLEIAAQ